jgi:Tfp pilus assembly protein PilF
MLRGTQRVLIFALLVLAIPGLALAADGVLQSADDSLKPASRPLRTAGQELLGWNTYQYYVNGLMYEGFDDLPRAAESFSKALEQCPESHQIRLSYAETLVQIRQPLKALSILKDAQPEDEMVLALRADAYRQMADDTAARVEYLKLVRTDSFNVQAYLFLAAFYQRKGDVDSTIWAYRNLERVRPDNYQVPNELGRLLAMKGEMDEARAAFRRSLDIVGPPENMPALANLVAVYERANQTDSVIALLEEGIHADSGNLPLRGELVRLYVQQDSLAKALPHQRAIVASKPTDIEARRRLAILLMGLDSLSAADSIVTGIVAEGADVYLDHYYLGQIAAVSENYPRAASEFRRALALDSTQVEAWLNLAVVFGSESHRDSAIAIYREGIEHMPDESSAVRLYFALGASYDQAGNTDSAVAVFEQIIEHQPNHDQALNYLGYALADRGVRLEYARDLIARALAIQPKNPAYLDSYGWVYYRMGQLDSAMVYLKAATELDNDPVILDHLGDVYQAAGDTAKAREIWQAVLERQPDNEAVREKLRR